MDEPRQLSLGRALLVAVFAALWLIGASMVLKVTTTAYADYCDRNERGWSCPNPDDD